MWDRQPTAPGYRPHPPTLTIAGLPKPPTTITSQQLQYHPATMTTHTPNAVEVNDDEDSTTLA